MAETPQDIVERELREFKRYTGDGLPGEPVNAPLPVGDPQSGTHNPKKVNLRKALLAPLAEASDQADRAEAAAIVASGAMTAILDPQFSTRATAEAFQPAVAPDYLRIAGDVTVDDGQGGLFAYIGDTDPEEDDQIEITLDDNVTKAYYVRVRDVDEVRLSEAFLTRISDIEAAIAPIAEDLTINVPTDYATIQLALDAAVPLRMAAGKEIIINLESGFKIPQSTLLERGDYSHIRITSEDATVFLDKNEFPTAFQGARFNGSSAYLQRTSDLTGNADGKVGSFIWRGIFNGGDGADQLLYESRTGTGDNGISIYRLADNTISIAGRNGAGAQILRLASTATIVAADGPVTIMASWDLENGLANLYIDNADVLAGSPTLTNANIDYTKSKHTFGARHTSSADRYTNADVSEFGFWLEYIDFSDVDVRRKVVKADNTPLPLGKGGKELTGNPAIIFLNGVVSYWRRNKGTGGDFTLSGSLSRGIGIDGTTSTENKDTVVFNFANCNSPVLDILVDCDDHGWQGIDAINGRTIVLEPGGFINSIHDNGEQRGGYLEAGGTLWTGAGERGLQIDNAGGFFQNTNCSDCVIGVSAQNAANVQGGREGSTATGIIARNCWSVGAQAEFGSTLNMRFGDVHGSGQGLRVVGGSTIVAVSCNTRDSAPNTPNVNDTNQTAFNALESGRGIIWV